MKVLVLSHQGRYERFAPKNAPAYQAAELVFCDRRRTGWQRQETRRRCS